jgi:hypothetical protein
VVTGTIAGIITGVWDGLCVGILDGIAVVMFNAFLIDIFEEKEGRTNFSRVFPSRIYLIFENSLVSLL